MDQEPIWNRAAIECRPLNQRSLPLATVKPTLKQRRLQRCTAKATPVFSIFFFSPILCAVTSVVEIRPPLPTVQGTLQQSSGGVTGPLGASFCSISKTLIACRAMHLIHFKPETVIHNSNIIIPCRKESAAARARQNELPCS